MLYSLYICADTVRYRADVTLPARRTWRSFKESLRNTAVHLALSGECRHAAGGGRGSAPPGRRDRGPEHPAHVGADPRQAHLCAGNRRCFTGTHQRSDAPTASCSLGGPPHPHARPAGRDRHCHTGESASALRRGSRHVAPPGAGTRRPRAAGDASAGSAAPHRD